MASVLPPRLQKSNSLQKDKSQSSLEILLQMGFTSERAEKAIAATGDRGVQLASDWLLSHVNDPFLDKKEPREYILYLCPVGELQKQLMAFWEKSLSSCGWNGAHSYFPHMTLCPVFTIDDSKVSVIKQALKTVRSTLSHAPGKLELDFFSQNNFIGIFLKENYLKFVNEVVAKFAAEVKKSGITVEKAKKQLHITLAYQYGPEHHEKLNALAREINPEASCHWDFRVYSRDSRLAKCEVRQVIKAYTPSLGDELELIDGDYVFMDPQEVTNSKDGWYDGTSWLTGLCGMFPGTYTKRTAETWTWTLHGSVPLEEVVENGAVGGAQEDYDNLWNAQPPPESLYAQVNKKRLNNPSVEKKKGPRRLYVVRHGERMDFAFGKDWWDKCFDDSGKYTRIDMNMPKSMLPNRYYLDHVKDAPLTVIGQMQARITGEEMKANGITINHCYCSSSLRCVQTATEILKALGINCVLCIEPGIFEWLGWYQLGLPKFMSPEDLKSAGFNIDTSYVPTYTVAKLDYDETIEGYYKRSGEVVRGILRRHEEEGTNILLIGHAGSADTCTRQLLGKPIRASSDFREICPKVPYCGMCVCEEDTAKKKWTMINSPLLTFTHGHNKGTNVKNMLMS